MRDQDAMGHVRQWPTEELTRGQRGLLASLGRCPPSSPMRVPLMDYLHAIKTELDQRNRPALPGPSRPAAIGAEMAGRDQS